MASSQGRSFAGSRTLDNFRQAIGQAALAASCASWTSRHTTKATRAISS
jgi:hypothetical protein